MVPTPLRGVPGAHPGRRRTRSPFL